MTRVLGLFFIIISTFMQAQDVPLSVNKIKYPDDKIVRLYDGEKVNILFLILSPEERPGYHLKAIRTIGSTISKNNNLFDNKSCMLKH